jgi:ABC-type polysaccharide/polyol phosphate export permease
LGLASEFREIVHEQVDYRELLYQMTLRDLLLRYKQTVMGFGWAIFMPLINTAVFSVVFMRVAHIETRVAYPLFAYAGFLFWNFFAGALRLSVGSLTGNTSLVTKIYFPREIFPFSAVLVCFVDLVVGSLVLVAMAIYYHIALTPAVLIVNVAFTAAMALLLAMGNLFYRDIKYLFEVVITVWMFATSVVYPLESVGGRLGALLAVNPMTQIVEAYRSVLLYGELPAAAPFVLTAVSSFVALAVAWRAFHRAEFTFAENI